MRPPFRFSPALPQTPPITFGDGLTVLGLAGLLYGALSLALSTPVAIREPGIRLSHGALPWYALLSTGRMAMPYGKSLVFGLL